MQRVRVGMYSVVALCAAAQASNPFLIVVSDAGGPSVKVYGTNPNLQMSPMMAAGPAPGLPEEFIVTTPPYLVPVPGNLAQPFGPLAKGAAVCTIPLDIDANSTGMVPCSAGPEEHGCGAHYFGHDVIVIGSGPGIAPPRVQVWMNYSNQAGRAERDTFRRVVEFTVGDFGPGYSSGVNVTAGDFNGDGNLDIAIGRRKGEPRIAFYTLDGSLLGPWASVNEFATDNGGAINSLLASDAVSDYVLPQTGNNELVAYPEVPADYNGGVRLATMFQYDSPLMTFEYSVLATAPGKGFKPWVKVWFLHDGTQHIPGTEHMAPAYCYPEDVALAQAYSPFVITEFLAFGAAFQGGVNLATFPEDFFGSGPGSVGPQNGFFPSALICAQSSGGGTVNMIGQTYDSYAFDKLFSFKPLGASYTGGVGVSSADRNLDFFPDILAFPNSTQTGALANVRSLRIAATAQGEKIVEDTLLRFKPFGNNRLYSSP